MEENNNQQYSNEETNQNTQYTAPQPPVQPPKRNGLAIASLVLGIFSLVFSCCCGILSCPCGIAGLILGVLALREKSDGKEMAIAGIIMSSIAVFLGILSIMLFVVFNISGNTSDMYYYWENFI